MVTRGPFGADGAFGDLHDDVAAGRIEARDVLLRDLGPVAAAALALDDLHAAVEVVRHDVPVVQEGVLLEADVHEGGLEAVFEVAHPAFEDAADQALLGGALDVELLELAVLEHGDAGFERLGVDDDFLVDLLDRLDQALDFLDQVGGGGADGFDDALGLLLDGHRLERLFLLHLRRGVQVRFAEIAFAGARGFRCFRRQAFRRQAGGDVFRALDFVLRGGAHRLSPVPDGPPTASGAGLGGFAVRLVLPMAEARRWGGSACRGGAGKSFGHS